MDETVAKHPREDDRNEEQEGSPIPDPEEEDTTAEQLVRACEIGRAEGLRYVYAGNLPGRVGRWENTYCHACGELLIERYGYIIRQMKVRPDGMCPSCSNAIPGIWS